MNNFEDTLVNPNNSVGNYQPVNSVFSRSSDIPSNASDRQNNNQTDNKLGSAGIFTLGLLLILAVAFVFVISHAF